MTKPLQLLAASILAPLALASASASTEAPDAAAAIVDRDGMIQPSGHATKPFSFVG